MEQDFEKLIDSYLDGEIDPAGVETLGNWIQADPAHAEHFLRCVALHWDVYSQLHANQAIDAAAQYSATHKPVVSSDPSFPASKRSVPLRFLVTIVKEMAQQPAMLAVLVVSLLSGAILAYHLSRQPTPLARTENGNQVVTSGNAKGDRPKPGLQPEAPGGQNGIQAASVAKPNAQALPQLEVARLTRSVGATWSGGPPIADGASLRSGQRIALDKGLAEIAFATGATVVLQGPAEMEVGSEGSGVRGQGAGGRSQGSKGQGSGGRSQGSGVGGRGAENSRDNACSLTLGKLVARVPKQAHGFTVHTSTLTIVDLGTEFGVTVQAAKNLPPDSRLPTPDSRPLTPVLTEVHVLHGEVSVQLAAAVLAQAPESKIQNPKSKILKAGEAVISEPGGAAPRGIQAEPTKFVRELPAEDVAHVSPKRERGRLQPGDILAVTRHTYKLLKIDPRTGKQTLLHEAKPQPLAGDWMCVLANRQGDVWVGAQGITQPGGALLKFDPRAGGMKLLASGGPLAAGNFHSLAAGADGTLYGALEDADDQIVSIDPRSGAAHKLVSWGNNIWGIAVDLGGRNLIAVGDYLGEVVQIRPQARGATVHPWTEKSGTEGCRGVAVRPDGRVFVAATKDLRCKIVEVDRTTHRVTEIVSIPQEPNHDFGMLAVEADGRLIVCETAPQSRIHRIDVDARTIIAVASGGDLEEVYGVAVVPGGPGGKKSDVEHGN